MGWFDSTLATLTSCMYMSRTLWQTADVGGDRGGRGEREMTSIMGAAFSRFGFLSALFCEANLHRLPCSFALCAAFRSMRLCAHTAWLQSISGKGKSRTRFATQT